MDDQSHGESTTFSRTPDAARPLTLVFVGLGAVATTTIAGTMLVRRGDHAPIGSLTQCPPASDPGLCDALRALSLPSLQSLQFSAIDKHTDDALTVARASGVLPEAFLGTVAAELRGIVPVPTIPALAATDFETSLARAEDRLRACSPAGSRAVVVLSLSTEPAPAGNWTLLDLHSQQPVTVPASYSVLFTLAALRLKLPVLNITPNSCVELRCIQNLASRHSTPIVGSDLKTGQTFVKTVLGPALSKRRLSLTGWYSTNLLGNSDGASLMDPFAGEQKRQSKSACLAEVFRSDPRGEDQETDHIVRIEYYRPRGDNKESWDCIDFLGWLGLPMSLRVNGLWRDSALAAPMVLDLALLLDASRRAGHGGPQAWLMPFFKSPVASAAGVVHDFHLQWEHFRAGLCQLAAACQHPAVAGADGSNRALRHPEGEAPA